MTDKLLYSSSEACALLSIGMTKLDYLKNDGELTPTYVGSSLLFARRDLEQFVARRRPTDKAAIDLLVGLIDEEGRIDVANIPEGCTLADLEAAKRIVAERQAVA